MATVYYAYNTTDLYLSNSDLSSDSTYGTSQGYSCGNYNGSGSNSIYNKSTCTKITILNQIQPSGCSYYFAHFKLVTEIIGLDKMDTSNVTNMGWMFNNCNSLTQLDVSNFDTSNVINISYMFSACKSLTSLDVSNFNTNNVTDILRMFNNCNSLTSLNLSNFDTSKVTDMSYMFYGCTLLTQLDISSFNTQNVTNMRDMFNGCSSLAQLDVSNFNTSNVIYMKNMFNGCSSLAQLDVSNFDTSKVTGMVQMFKDCSNLTTIYSNNFDISNVTDSLDMFTGSTKLVGAIPYDSTKTDATMANYVTGYFTKLKKPYITILKNKQDDTIYPRTLTSAVYDKDGKTLEDKLKSYSPGIGVSITNGVVSVNLPSGENVKY